MNRPFVIGIVLFVIVLGTFVFLLKRQAVEEAQQTPGSSRTASTNASRDQRKINVRLFFHDPNQAMLVMEERVVTYHPALRDQAYEVLKELIHGSQQGYISTIPEGTVLRDVFLTNDGIAYVDFSAELSENHSGGSTAEICTVYAIVNALTVNFPQIKGVQILVDDRAVESLKGHLDLSRPLKQNLSIVLVRSPHRPETAESF